MKIIIFFSLLVNFQISVFAQSKSYFFGVPAPFAYSKLGAVKGTAGIIGDNYYVLENDYGGKFDFNNNITTYLTCFSIGEGKFKNRVNLNQLVANSKKELNKILFCDVVAWKDKIIGFYTYKNPSGKNFLANAMICDRSGKLIKDAIDIGDFEHDYASGSFLWQGGLLVNGRNTLSVVNDFQYRFTPDSSRIIVLCRPDATGNVKFKTYDNNLIMQKEIIGSVPLKEKVADMIDFAMDNYGNVYVLTKTYKSKSERKKISDDDDNYFEVHILNTNDNNKVTTLAVNLAGKAINTAELILKKDNQVYCCGNYWNADNKRSRGNITGVFSAYIDNSNRSRQAMLSSYDLPDSVLKYLNFDKKIKRENGLDAKFGSYESVPDKDGGMYVIIANEVSEVTVRGTTGAMNTSGEFTKNFIINYIGPDKKIKWAVGWRELARNPAMMTRIDRSCFFESDHKLLAAFVSAHMIKMEQESLYSRVFNKQNGDYQEIKLMGTLKDPYRPYRSLEKTLLPLGDNEYVVTMVSNGVTIARFKVE